MADLEQKFQEAADSMKNLKTRPTDEELLELYALFKQGTIGDNNEPKPSMFQLKEKAKYEFWLKKKGMSQDEAKQTYINRAKVLVDTYGLKE